MKTGWILQEEGKGRFIDSDGAPCDLEDANVFKTRKIARSETGDDNIAKLDTDVVRKVKLDKQGKAIKIIPGR